MSKVIGIRSTSFRGNDGSEVSGYNIYISDDIDPKYGEGVTGERIFLTDQKLSNIGYRPSVGDRITVMYNRYGKVASLVFEG